MFRGKLYAIALSVFLFVMLLPLLSTKGKQRQNAYRQWKHSASLFILTTPEGANLPASASEKDFPLLVRLNRETFSFQQAKPNGEDVRFSSNDGTPLLYQIDEWDSVNGAAVVWVRIPQIRGNARQEITVHWGNSEAVRESNGSAVFNTSNGYLSVLHLGDAVQDEVGTVHAENIGTTLGVGIIGKGRHFAGGQGIFCGEQIPNYPTGGAAHSTEAWFRIEKPNATIIGWGNERGGRGSKVRMQFRSPPHLHIDSDFSDVRGRGLLPMSEWIHVVHTYQNGEGRIYINGQLDGADRPTLDIKRPARMWIGGWYNNYDFIGEIDETRISKTARSADWVKLEYENQKPLQTLVGSLAQSGGELSVSQERLTVSEGKSATITACAGGAQKVYWTLKQEGHEAVVAVDSYRYTIHARRVIGDTPLILRFKAIYPNEVKTKDIPVVIKEDVPEPAFSLNAPSQWDGRKTIEVTPNLLNLTHMEAKGAGKLSYTWSVSGSAAITETVHGKLVLKRAQNSGDLTVTLSLSNGGAPTTHATTIRVREPKRDVWVSRTPASDEKPEDNQFYPRDEKNEGTLFYNGNMAKEHYASPLAISADAVFLRLYAGDELVKTVNQRLARNRGYALTVKLKPGLIRYRVEFGAKSGGHEVTLRTLKSIVCGDVFLIDGQSNAEATAWGDEAYTFTSDWIRSYGSTEGGGEGARLKLWGNATACSEGGRLQIGYWGMELARRLVESQGVPICILNGAVGGTRIDQHQRSPKTPDDVSTIYGRLLWRVQQARLTHGVRGVLWHQGENDQGADGPTGGYGWETYRQYFVEMSSAWKQDYPNIQRYYLFQIWPKSCSMGINGSDNRLREVQRTLPSLYSRMSVMSTLGVKPPGGCHFPPAGYAEIARLICGLVERDSYGKVAPASVSPPNLKRAYYTNEKRDKITLEFDQPVVWANALASQFYLDDVSGRVSGGVANGATITITLSAPVNAKTITYLDSKAWNENSLLYGLNGIAALTFCEVSIRAGKP
ncbi:hypothetical protein LBMAG21_10080 [Armatimonadota bacterium]|nr:hypothetical protein LBMAG21_10080 [Armatimonadota bacterium]